MGEMLLEDHEPAEIDNTRMLQALNVKSSKICIAL
jgi:hypothetical protein